MTAEVGDSSSVERVAADREKGVAGDDPRVVGAGADAATERSRGRRHSTAAWREVEPGGTDVSRSGADGAIQCPVGGEPADDGRRQDEPLGTEVAQFHDAATRARRAVLRVGGVSILGAALIAACSGDDGPDAATDPTSGDASGTDVADDASMPDPSSTADEAARPPSADDPSTTGDPDAASPPTTVRASRVDGDPADADLELLRTATSLELAVVQTYQALLDNVAMLGVTGPVAEAAALFQSHHVEHATALQEATVAADGIPYEEPNRYLLDEVIAPALRGVTDETGVVEVALMLEVVASQTHTFAGSALGQPILRQTAASIGGAEERHATVWRGVLGRPQVPDSFNPTDDAASDDSFVGPG